MHGDNSHHLKSNDVYGCMIGLPHVHIFVWIKHCAAHFSCPSLRTPHARLNVIVTPLYVELRCIAAINVALHYASATQRNSTSRRVALLRLLYTNTAVYIVTIGIWFNV